MLTSESMSKPLPFKNCQPLDTIHTIQKCLQQYENIRDQYKYYLGSLKDNPSLDNAEAQDFKNMVLTPRLGADQIAQNVFRVITNQLIIQDASLYQGLIPSEWLIWR